MFVLFIILQILIGIIFTDFMSGILHYMQDNFFKEDWPILGRIAEDGRGHHEDPMKFTKSNFFVRNWYVMLASAIIFVAWFTIFGLSWFIVTAVIFGSIIVEIQYYTHVKDVPKWVQPLHKIGIFQSPKHHENHHTSWDGHYCVVTDWVNPVLNKIGFWKFLKKILG